MGGLDGAEAHHGAADLSCNAAGCEALADRVSDSSTGGDGDVQECEPTHLAAGQSHSGNNARRQKPVVVFAPVDRVRVRLAKARTKAAAARATLSHSNFGGSG